MGDGNYGIGAPGEAVWGDGVEDTIRESLGLSPVEEVDVSQVGPGVNDESVSGAGATDNPNAQTAMITGKEEIKVGDGDTLAENIALGATGAGVTMGGAYAYHLGRRDRGDQGDGDQHPEPTDDAPQEPPTEVDKIDGMTNKVGAKLRDAPLNYKTL